MKKVSLLSCAVAVVLSHAAAAADQAPAPASPPAARAAVGRGPFAGLCVFSSETMYATSKISTASNQRLQQLRDEAQAEADRDQAALRVDRKSLEEGQAGLSPALLKQLQDRLAEHARAVTSKVQLRTLELERTRQQATAQISGAAMPIIREIERANSCSVLLQRESVIDAPAMVDITTPVIAAMDSRLQPTPFQRLSLNGNQEPPR